MTTDEEWRPVPGFENYDVTADGRVRSWLSRNGRGGRRSASREMKVSPNPLGYPVVTLSKQGVGHTKLVHRLILEAFVGPPPAGMEGCHNDGDPTNCNLSNVRWDTRSENMLDRARHGKAQRGERSTNARLSERDVLEISSFLHAGIQSVALAKRYGVHKATIQEIKAGRNWGWLTGRAA